MKIKTSEVAPSSPNAARRLFKTCRAFLLPTKRERCTKYLYHVARQCPDLLTGFIQEKAMEVAEQMLMKMFDTQGIHHCHVCPQRFELRKTASGVYLCKAHALHHPAATPSDAVNQKTPKRNSADLIPLEVA